MTRRLGAAVAVGGLVLLAFPLRAWAHGIGGRGDLPVPLSYFIAGAATVLVITFAGLALLWPKPRLQEPDPNPRQWSVPGWRSFVLLLQVVGVVTLAVVVATGLFGVDDSGLNPAPVLVWVVFWLFVPFLSVLVGDWYGWLSPWESLARWGGLGAGGEDRNRRFGLWPATILFLAFTWFELVYPDPSAPRVLALAAIIYTALMLLAYEYLGAEASRGRLDAFAAYNRLISGIAPFDLQRDNGPAWRGWLRGLPAMAEPPGLTVFVITMIGTVSYDGLSGTSWYEETFALLGVSLVGGTILLLSSVVLIGLAYWLACRYAARFAGPEWSANVVASRFAHTLVPVAFAYAFAHYFTLVLFEGQLVISTLSDPFHLGWDLFGTANRGIDYTLISPVGVWWVQVATIVVGHVAGVVLAHDRALVDFGPGAVRSQYVMLGLMVVLTGLGLTILAGG